jgi:hypothetical protein
VTLARGLARTSVVPSGFTPIRDRPKFVRVADLAAAGEAGAGERGGREGSELNQSVLVAHSVLIAHIGTAFEYSHALGRPQSQTPKNCLT